MNIVNADHVKAYRVKFVIDEDARFEECNGQARPLTRAEYAEAEYQKDGKPVPYAEYRRYYGNPDRHVYLGCVVEAQCPCCDGWTADGASLWRIDFMDDDRAYQAVTLDKWYTPAEAIKLPDYAGSVAGEILSEAGYK